MNRFGVYNPEYIKDADLADRSFTSSDKIENWGEGERSNTPMIIFVVICLSSKECPAL